MAPWSPIFVVVVFFVASPGAVILETRRMSVPLNASSVGYDSAITVCGSKILAQNFMVTTRGIQPVTLRHLPVAGIRLKSRRKFLIH